MTEWRDSERGATMVIVAASLVALFGFAALAVDGSGFYQTARVDQTTADLSCLAGVAELPDTTQAIDTAVAYTKANWPEMSSASVTVTGDTGTLSDGNGNTVTYEVNHGGDPDVMYVGVTDRDPTTFGKVVGVTSVDISQEAACRKDSRLGGPGALPLGALAGTFGGDLFDCSAKVTGNCGALDSGSGANAFRDSIADGWDQQLEKHHGVETNPDADTGDAVISCPSVGPCSADNSETGNMSGPFRQGLDTRFGINGAVCTLPGPFNCDTLTDVLGSAPQQLEDASSSEPGWWEESLYGPYDDAKALTNQYFFNGDIAHCDSPRLGLVPIVWTPQKNHDPLNWDIGDAPGTWPNGKKEMKIIGFYTVYIREPNTPAEVGSGAIEADIIYLGPNATCDGGNINFNQTGVQIESVLLVQP